MNIIFIDVEASAFNGFPIEVGLVKADLSDGWSTTIQPTAKWVQTYPWDKQAELLHGLKWRKLMNQGMAPKKVAERLNADLAGAEVYSDAPGYDGKWLGLLFAAAEIQQGFMVRDASAFIKQTTITKAAFPIDYGEVAWNLFLKAGGKKHRALDDACLQALYLQVIDILATADKSQNRLIERAKILISAKGRS